VDQKYLLYLQMEILLISLHYFIIIHTYIYKIRVEQLLFVEHAY